MCDAERMGVGGMDIKIFVTHSPNQNNKVIEDSNIFYNIVGGAALCDKKIENGDNRGSNISCKNHSYCELTTQYWAWKNVQADYYGFCHYRRYFSFGSKLLPESRWYRVEYPFMTKASLEEIGLNDENVSSFVEKYDFIIAKGVNTRLLSGSNSVYEHYSDAKALRIEDLDLMLTIIRQKYSFLYNAANEYIYGNIFYPCNMFIMNKRLFKEYSEILFGILNEFEKKRCMDDYSREAYRTPGHLGERILGIYYTYIKNRQEQRLTEVQQVFFENVEKESEFYDDKKSIPVVLAANDKFVPVMSVCIQSIVDSSSLDRDYYIFVLHTDIKRENQEILKRYIGNIANFKIEFVNVRENIGGYRLEAKEHITNETFYRFLILDRLKNFSKVIYIDCDTVVKKDLAGLYDLNIGESYIGAASDPDFIGQCYMKGSSTREYAEQVLNLEDPKEYFQAGVLVLNIEQLRKVYTVQDLLKMSENQQYRYSDQDVLNVVCRGKWFNIGMQWNLLTDCDHTRVSNVIKFAPEKILSEYENARKNPYIIHYAGFLKPWQKLGEDFGDVFWKAARNSLFYENLLNILREGPPCSKKRMELSVVGIYNWLLPEEGKIRKCIRAYIKPLFYKSAAGMKIVKFMK